MLNKTYTYQEKKFKAVKDNNEFTGCKGCYFKNSKVSCHFILEEMDAPFCYNYSITFREVTEK